MTRAVPPAARRAIAAAATAALAASLFAPAACDSGIAEPDPGPLVAVGTVEQALPKGSAGAYEGYYDFVYELSGGQGVAEAEHPSDQELDTTEPVHAWNTQTSPASGAYSGASGGEYVLSEPDTTPAQGAVPPSLRYYFEIPAGAEGDYVAYVRGAADNTGSDSVHVAIHTPDGTLQHTAPFNVPFSGTSAWEWRATTAVTLAAAGLYYVRLSMREDGTSIDKVVLQEATLTAPTGTGPAESAHVALGPMGYGDYCTGGDLCTLGEGDCDAHSECEGTLVCGVDNLDRYHPNKVCQGCDACTPPHCTNGLLDAANGERDIDCGGDCGSCSEDICPVWPDGHMYHCSRTCPCPEGEADCDENVACQGTLVCNEGLGPQFGYPTGHGVCVQPHCKNGQQDSESGELGVDCGGPCGNCLWGPGPGTSCDAFDQNLCGPLGTENCCASPEALPGTFTRNYDGLVLLDNRIRDATVSNFFLDKFEVTVGRFRKFVEAFDAWRTAGKPAAGAGAHPSLAGSGWDSSWPLAADAQTLRSNLQCDQSYQTWTETNDPAQNEARPINCVNWYEAFAFCVWDRGRLPTDAELNGASAGGTLQRVYPWSTADEPTLLTAAHANYDCGTDACSSSPNEIFIAGSLPTGAARWGHHDLTGNVWEWALDFYIDPLPYPCTNCANLTALGGKPPFDGGTPRPDTRVIRGGSWATEDTDKNHLLSGWRESALPAERRSDRGFRCVRK